MIVVTGGAGFVGSNVVHALNARGVRDILVVDDLSDSRKVANLLDADIADYLDRDDFLALVEAGTGLDHVTSIIHQGACTSTTEPDGRYVMRANLGYSTSLLNWCLARSVPLVYASSAAVYGAGDAFGVDARNERPLNVYGWSKLLFDQRVRRALPDAECQIVGLRYFNVYGPRESHKDEMASMVLQLDDQIAAHGEARIFGAGAGCDAGSHRRDFVHVDDVVSVLLWFFDHPDRSGVFNCGTGTSRSFEEVAHSIIEFRGTGRLAYMPFPTTLEARYQSFTEADLATLRAAGCDVAFTPVEDGVAAYLAWRTSVGERS